MNNDFAMRVEQMAETVDAILADQMGLMPPQQYDVVKRDERVYVVASFDPMLIGRHLKVYQHPDTLRVISKALGGLPVVWTQRTGFRLVVLASGKLSLPRSVDFPGFSGNETFRLGVCLKGEVAPTPQRMGNVIIGANQGAGKSNVEKLMAYQARQAGWKLYLCDPDSHTFNPDIWDKMAAMPVASSPNDLVEVLDRLHGEIADRAAMFRAIADGGIPPADLDAYNALLTSPLTPPQIAGERRDLGRGMPLPRMMLVVDEANSFMDDKRIFKSLADLLRRGRKWGLHIVLGGHEWHKDVVPASVNDMLQTRIGLTVANEETAQVVLRSRRWGKWVMGKPAGRGVIRIDQYQPMQFYLVTEEMEREWLSGATQPISTIPEEEAELVRRSLEEEGGRFTQGLLQLWGLGPREARSLLERYEARGWVEQDPKRSNGRYVTEKLSALVTNRQTRQTPSNPQMLGQTADKPRQTTYMGYAE